MKLIALLLLPAIGFSQTKLIPARLVDDKVEILVPATFIPITDYVWKQKYHDIEKPILALSDTLGEVNFIATQTPQALQEKQLNSFRDFQIEGLKKKHPELRIIKSRLTTVNDKKIGSVTFSTLSEGHKIFNYYFFTVINGKALLFSFNCLDIMRNDWEKIADKMVVSLKIK